MLSASLLRGRASGWPFNLFMRLYWPKAEIIDGTWKPPAVTRVVG